MFWQRGPRTAAIRTGSRRSEGRKSATDTSLINPGNRLGWSETPILRRKVTKFSMYAACFSNLAMLSSTALDIHGPHRWPLSYILDDGNPYRSQIVESQSVLLKAFPRIAAIEFQSDTHVSALQAADVSSWTL